MPQIATGGERAGVSAQVHATIGRRLPYPAGIQPTLKCNLCGSQTAKRPNGNQALDAHNADYRLVFFLLTLRKCACLTVTRHGEQSPSPRPAPAPAPAHLHLQLGPRARAGAGARAGLVLPFPLSPDYHVVRPQFLVAVVCCHAAVSFLLCPGDFLGLPVRYSTWLAAACVGVACGWILPIHY